MAGGSHCNEEPHACNTASDSSHATKVIRFGRLASRVAPFLVRPCPLSLHPARRSELQRLPAILRQLLPHAEELPGGSRIDDLSLR